MKTISIVVPVYNTENYIRKCLDSLLVNEILKDIEVIVVNDGSKDNSIQVMQEYKNKFVETVVLINKINGGHGSTINEGLKIAKGKYFRVVDSDDWVNSTDFVRLVKILKKEDADLVVTNYRKEHIYENRSEYLKYEGLEEKKYKFNEFNIENLKTEFFTMSTSVYKTAILRKSKLNLLEKTFYVDMQYNIVPIKEVETFRYINLDIYRYFIGRKEQSMDLQNFVKNQEHHEKVVKYLVEYYTKNKEIYAKTKKEYIKKILYNMIYTHYCIYCIYDSQNRKRAYKRVKQFDKYLKEQDSELYNLYINSKMIEYNRKLGFIPTILNGTSIYKSLKFVAKK
jgi:glycosyltransferase involved in cell wall biosynthesis